MVAKGPADAEIYRRRGQRTFLGKDNRAVLLKAEDIGELHTEALK